MKKLTFLILPLLAFGLITPVFADSQISGFTDGGICCSPNPQGSALLGVCFTISNSFALTRATLSLSKDDPNTGSPPFVGTLIALIYATTGNPSMLTCSSGVGSILATSNSIAFTALPQSPTFATETFNFAGETLSPGSYIIAISMGYTSGAGSISFTGNANMDASQANVDDGGSFGTFTPGDEYNCSIFGANTCMSYQLFGNVPSTSGFSNGVNEASVFIIVAMVVLIVSVARGNFKGKPETVDNVVLPAIIVLGVFFIVLQALAALT